MSKNIAMKHPETKKADPQGKHLRGNERQAKLPLDSDKAEHL